MSRLFSQLLLAASAALFLPALHAEDVAIPDPRLDALIRTTLAKPTGTLTDADLATLTVLNANALPDSQTKVSDLTGLEYAVNLSQLNLPSQNVSDLTPVANLDSLNWLLLPNNSVTDLSPIAGLGSLNYLDLTANGVSDIAPLATVPQLRILVMPYNPISDFSPLNQLTSLTSLSLRSTQFTSLDLISSLTNLETLELSENRLISLENIDQFPKLKQLQIFGNFLTDITPATGLPLLTLLSLHQNYIDFSTGSDNAAALTTLRDAGVSINNTTQRVATLAVSAGSVSDPYHTEGGTGSLAVSSNSYWHVSSDSDWLTITSPENAFQNDPIAFSVAASPSLQGARIATITVQDLSNTATFQVTQRPFIAINIPDANLEKAIRQTVDNTTEPLTDHQLESLTSLKVTVSALSSESRKIHDLSGLEYAFNLESLELDNHSISDLFPLSGMVKLKKLSLINNVISQLDPLLFQTSLNEIHLEQNFISETEINGNFLLTSIKNSGGTVTTDPQNTPEISLFLSPDTMGLEGGTGTLEIDSNFAWTVVSDSDWLTFTTSASGTRDGQVGYKVAAAPDLESERVATLTVQGETTTVIQRPPIPVTFADSDLANVIRNALDLAENEEITDLELRTLTSLTLTRNVLDPDVTTLSGLEYAKNLESLSISNHSISSLGPLAEIAGLKSLSVSNTILQDLDALNSLKRLESLTLQNCRLSQFPSLACEETLTVLDISDNRLADVSPIIRLTHLTYVDLRFNPIVNISPLSVLEQLTFLDISETRPSSLEPLHNSTSIQELYLSGTGISDLSPITNLSNIRTLDISDNAITSLSPLSRFVALIEIYGSTNLVEDLSPILPLPNLQRIDFSLNRIHSLEPFEVSPNTEYLYLSNNFIKDIAPLGQMPSLLELDIQGNFIDFSAGSLQNSELETILENGTNVSSANQTVHTGTIGNTDFATGSESSQLSTTFTNNGYLDPQTEEEWLSFELDPFASSGTLIVHIETNDLGVARSADIDLGFATIHIEQSFDSEYAAYLESRELDPAHPLYGKFADTDGDGSGNYFEYRAGFDLLDRDSVLELRIVNLGDGTFEIRHTPLDPSLSHSIDSSSDLSQWDPISLQNSRNENGFTVVTHTPGTAQVFYRISFD